MKTRLLAAAFASSLLPTLGFAWDYAGHRLVEQVALASLPSDYPAFVHEPANAERVAFLAGEPDRWRNTQQMLLSQANGVDHYIDMEMLNDAGLDLRTVSSFRYDFIVAFAEGRAAHPDKFPAAKNDTDHSRGWPGFLPWAITENYAKLRSEFSYYKEFLANGTPEEIENAKQDILYTMGVMGHYVGDGAQPLHSTVHHHGWVGANPNGYTTKGSIHAWIDGGFIDKVKIGLPELLTKVVPAVPIQTPAREDKRDPIFVATVDYLLVGKSLVEPLYLLEKAGKFSGTDLSPTAEGRTFIDDRLVAGGEELGALWLTAWREAGPDTYLRSTLVKRKAAAP